MFEIINFILWILGPILPSSHNVDGIDNTDKIG